MKSFLEADINISAASANTIVADTANRVVKVWGIWLVASGGANNLTFSNGISSPVSFNAGTVNLANGGSLFFAMNEVGPWFTSTKGNGFGITLSAATVVAGRLYYTLE